MRALRRSWILLSVLLLSWTPSVASAAGDGDYVRVTDVDVTHTRREWRSFGKPLGRTKFAVESDLTISVENRLDVAVDSLSFDVPGYERGSNTGTSWRSVPAHAVDSISFIFRSNAEPPLGSPTAYLKSYRLAVDPALTPRTAWTLLLLANSDSLLDQAVAAKMLPRLGPDAELLREELRPWVAGGPLKHEETFGAGIGRLYALRLLGRVGTGEDVALLLSSLKSDEAHAPSLAALELVRAEGSDHPMAQLFASGTGARAVVETALRDIRPELAAPALVKLVYRPGPLQSEARAFLRTWKVEELAAALLGPHVVESLQVLCASRDPEVVPLVVRLGSSGVEGVDFEACLAALPERNTLGELVRVLGDELVPVEGVVLEFLASRGHGRELLLARARELGIPAEQDTGKLVRAVRDRLVSLRVDAFLKALAEAEEVAREERYDAALQLLGQVRERALTREQRIQVAAAHARVGQAVIRDDLGRVDQVIDALVGLPSEWARDAVLEPELVKLVQAISVHAYIESASERLSRIERWADASVHPKLAQAYMDMVGEMKAPDPGRYAERALTLDSSNAAARDLLQKLEQERAWEQRRTIILVGSGLLGLSVLVFLIRWREISKNRARKRRAVELLANGTPPQVAAQQLVFEEGLSYGDASFLLTEAVEEARRGRGPR